MGKIIGYSLLICYCLFPALSFSQDEDDPDLPKRVNGIDKEQYLIERQNYFLMRQGDPSRFTVNPRTVAIETLVTTQLYLKKSI